MIIQTKTDARFARVTLSIANTKDWENFRFPLLNQSEINPYESTETALKHTLCVASPFVKSENSAGILMRAQ